MIRWLKKNAGTFVASCFLLVPAVAAGYFLWQCIHGSRTPEYYTAIGELLLVIVLAVEGLLAVVELRGRGEDRKQESLVNVIARVTEHNWAVIADSSRRAVLDKTRSFKTGDSEAEKTEYWAARAVHLSHV